MGSSECCFALLACGFCFTKLYLISTHGDFCFHPLLLSPSRWGRDERGAGWDQPVTLPDTRDLSGPQCWVKAKKRAPRFIAEKREPARPKLFSGGLYLYRALWLLEAKTLSARAKHGRCGHSGRGGADGAERGQAVGCRGSGGAGGNWGMAVAAHQCPPWPWHGSAQLRQPQKHKRNTAQSKANLSICPSATVTTNSMSCQEGNL